MLSRRTWLVGVVVLIAAAATARIVAPSARPPQPSAAAAGAPVQFGTLPPGAKLPSGTQCARWVRASPSPENRPANKTFNDTAGQHVGPGFFPVSDSPQVKALAARISGAFTGTTEEILRWAACKWGISQDIVFAQAAVESWWQQDELGDWGTQAGRCPPGHGRGADGRPGACPESYGILQDKYPLEQPSWPGIGKSTAMNADAAYAIWRSCYAGYEVWLNDEPKGRLYRAGDVWGCVGRWNTGSWYTTHAESYIKLVQEYLRERIWDQPAFKQAG